jgi:hypothetical protein
MCEYRNALVTDLFNKIREPSTFLDVRDPVKLVYDHNRILAAPSVRDFQQPMNHRVELTRRLISATRLPKVVSGEQASNTGS